MEQFSVHDATTHLPHLLERVEAGDEILIARAGRPVARLVAYRGAASKRTRPWRGRLRMRRDFDQLASELADVSRACAAKTMRPNAARDARRPASTGQGDAA